MSTYSQNFDETKQKFLLVKVNELLVKYNRIWSKVSNSMKKGLNRESVYNKEYLKLKSHEQKISTTFQVDKISKEGSHRICLSVILINSVVRSG